MPSQQRVSCFERQYQYSARSTFSLLQTYCENNASIDGGGWAMVWKHSYKQALIWEQRTSYSKISHPCLNLDDGWCNVGNKQPSGYTEQMVAAYHNQTLVYAYKAPLNPSLGIARTGPYLSSNNMIVDRCTATRGTRPGIIIHHKYMDIFQKSAPESYFTFNCDTVHLRYWADCRWESCKLPPAISVEEQHVQMTVVIYIR